MFYYTDNPVSDAERYYNDKEKELERLPVCSECENPIQTETCYVINGKAVCKNCMEEHKTYTEDLMKY